MKKSQLSTLLLPVVFALVACGDTGPEETTSSAPTTPTRQLIEATVVATEPSRRQMTLDVADGPEGRVVSAHEGDINLVSPGDLIRGEYFPYQDGYRIERVFKVHPVAEKVAGDVNAQLRRVALRMSPGEVLLEGDTVPNFALFDQNSDVIQSRSWRGERIIMNFIFTRCGNVDMCPASTARMARIQKEAADRGIEDLRLVTISFDPGFDTPGILRQYATDRGISFDNFSLLTGDREAVRDILRVFGIATRGDPNPMMEHTMATLLIDTNGRIAYRKEGSRWSVEEFLAQLES